MNLIRKQFDAAFATQGLMVVPAHRVLLDGSYGPFRCDNCTWFSDDTSLCAHPEITKLNGGRVKPDWCSDYFDSRNPGKSFRTGEAQ